MQQILFGMHVTVVLNTFGNSQKQSVESSNHEIEEQQIIAKKKKCLFYKSSSTSAVGYLIAY